MSHILVTNDDGYQSPGLQALVRALVQIAQVTAFAPDHNWSAAGHTKTMHKPLRITEGTLPDGTALYITSGTPSDCVSLALLGAVPDPIDLIVSGINHGSNVGHDVTYSGTVAAAMEGAVAGLPAIAVSQEVADDRSGQLAYAAGLVARLAGEVLKRGLPPNCLLNVNFPALPPANVRGLQVTRLGKRIYRDVLVRRLDPKGRPYYWIGGDQPVGEPLPGTDVGALAEGCISITPLNLDMTDHQQLAQIAGWGIQLAG